MDKTLAKEAALLEKLKEHLENGQLAKCYETEDEDEAALLASYNLLTYKPVIFAANVAEEDLADDGAGNDGVKRVKEFATENDSEVFVICPRSSRRSLSWMRKRRPCSWRIWVIGVRAAEADQGELSYPGPDEFLTAGRMRQEHGRSRSVRRLRRLRVRYIRTLSGALSRQRWSTIRTCWSRGLFAAAREKGLVGMEGKEYVVQDGDVILFPIQCIV